MKLLNLKKTPIKEEEAKS